MYPDASGASRCRAGVVRDPTPVLSACSQPRMEDRQEKHTFPSLPDQSVQILPGGHPDIAGHLRTVAHLVLLKRFFVKTHFNNILKHGLKINFNCAAAGGRCPDVQAASKHRGLPPSSCLFKKLRGAIPSHTQGAEDLQEEWTKPPTQVTVPNKPESVAAERGCPQTHTFIFFRCLPKVLTQIPP